MTGTLRGPGFWGREDHFFACGFPGFVRSSKVVAQRVGPFDLRAEGRDFAERDFLEVAGVARSRTDGHRHFDVAAGFRPWAAGAEPGQVRFDFGFFAHLEFVAAEGDRHLGRAADLHRHRGREGDLALLLAGGLALTAGSSPDSFAAPSGRTRPSGTANRRCGVTFSSLNPSAACAVMGISHSCSSSISTSARPPRVTASEFGCSLPASSLQSGSSATG